MRKITVPTMEASSTPMSYLHHHPEKDPSAGGRSRKIRIPIPNDLSRKIRIPKRLPKRKEGLEAHRQEGLEAHPDGDRGKI
jgi:hypothetical protein